MHFLFQSFWTSSAAKLGQDSTDNSRVAQEVTWGPIGKPMIQLRKWGQIINIRESNVATGNPLEMEVLMVKSSINGGLSIAMYRMAGW